MPCSFRSFFAICWEIIVGKSAVAALIDAIDFQRIATAAIGAIVLSTACIAAAVAPARAIETSPAFAAAAPASDAARG